MEPPLKKSLIIIVLSLFINLCSIQAETIVAYPDEDPVFSVNFPDSWNIKIDEEQLYATSDDESIYCGLQALENVEDLEDALDALSDETDEIFDSIEVNEEGEAKINNIPFVFIEANGQVDDTVVKISLAVFSTDGETFFIGIFFGPPEIFKQHKKEIDGIVDSVEAIN